LKFWNIGGNAIEPQQHTARQGRRLPRQLAHANDGAAVSEFGHSDRGVDHHVDQRKGKHP
jgi:hypothetical protein